MEKKKKAILWSIIGGSILLIGIILFCFISGTIIATLNGMNKTSDHSIAKNPPKETLTKENRQNNSVAQKTRVVGLSANILIKEYACQPEESENLLFNTSKTVNGALAFRDTNDSGNDILFIVQDGAVIYPISIKCLLLKSEKEKVYDLQKGMVVSVKGVIGHFDGKHINMSQCEIVALGPCCVHLPPESFFD